MTATDRKDADSKSKNEADKKDESRGKSMKPSNPTPNPDKPPGLLDPKTPLSPLTGPIVSSFGKPTDDNHVYRRWLESKTKQELVELILAVDTQEPDAYITGRMITMSGKMNTDALAEAVTPSIKEFARLPVLAASRAANPQTRWRFVLVSIDPAYKPIGLEIDSEITIGRFAGGAMPDLDLGMFGGGSKGVSRKHARLRPTAKSLMLVDENSTNGTTVNAARVASETPRELKDRDVIGFGQVRFVVMIADKPAEKPV